jgi:hypothetical protein
VIVPKQITLGNGDRIFIEVIEEDEDSEYAFKY